VCSHAFEQRFLDTDDEVSRYSTVNEKVTCNEFALADTCEFSYECKSACCVSNVCTVESSLQVCEDTKECPASGDINKYAKVLITLAVVLVVFVVCFFCWPFFGAAGAALTGTALVGSCVVSAATLCVLGGLAVVATVTVVCLLYFTVILVAALLGGFNWIIVGVFLCCLALCAVACCVGVIYGCTKIVNKTADTMHEATYVEPRY